MLPLLVITIGLSFRTHHRAETLFGSKEALYVPLSPTEEVPCGLRKARVSVRGFPSVRVCVDSSPYPLNGLQQCNTLPSRGSKYLFPGSF